MDDTPVGQDGNSESQPEDVAHQGIEALLSGKDHVYAASAKTKLEGMLANVVPGSVKGAMHEKMAKPEPVRSIRESADVLQRQRSGHYDTRDAAKVGTQPEQRLCGKVPRIDASKNLRPLHRLTVQAG